MTKMWMSAGVVLALAALGCGETDEARLQELAGKLERKRAAVAEAQAFVEEKAAAVVGAEEDLDAARKQLQTAEQQLRALEQEAVQTASDPVLFRLVQKRLLESDELEGVAIVASVENGGVTLSGDVPVQALRARAGEVARAVPGVVSVTNNIRVITPVAAGSPEATP